MPIVVTVNHQSRTGTQNTSGIVEKLVAFLGPVDHPQRAEHALSKVGCICGNRIQFSQVGLNQHCVIVSSCNSIVIDAGRIDFVAKLPQHGKREIDSDHLPVSLQQRNRVAAGSTPKVDRHSGVVRQVGLDQLLIQSHQRAIGQRGVVARRDRMVVDVLPVTRLDSIGAPPIRCFLIHGSTGVGWEMYKS